MLGQPDERQDASFKLYNMCLKYLAAFMKMVISLIAALLLKGRMQDIIDALFQMSVVNSASPSLAFIMQPRSTLLLFLLLLIAMATLNLVIARSGGVLVITRRISILVLLFTQLRIFLDYRHNSHQESQLVMRESIAVIHGAESPLAQSLASHLLSIGYRVTLVCRSFASCKVSAAKLHRTHPNVGPDEEAIRLVSSTCDPKSLQSIAICAAEILRMHSKIDLLATLDPTGLQVHSGSPSEAIDSFCSNGDNCSANYEALEFSLSAGYVSSFLLTQALLPALIVHFDKKAVKNPSIGSSLQPARLISIYSQSTALRGKWHSSLFSNATGHGDWYGEVTKRFSKEGVARAHLARLLHLRELFVRLSLRDMKHQHRSLHIALIDPGQEAFESSVGPNSFLDRFLAGLFLKRLRRWFRRPSDWASFQLVQEIFPSNVEKEISHARGVVINSAGRIEFMKSFGNHELVPLLSEGDNTNPMSSLTDLSSRIWDLTDQMLRDFFDGKPLFQTEVGETKRNNHIFAEWDRKNSPYGMYTPLPDWLFL